MTDRKWIGSFTVQTVAALALIAVVVVQILAWRDGQRDAAEIRTLMLEPRYEYKVVIVAADAHGRTGDGAMKPSSVKLDEKALAQLGNQGWEIVGSYLELETAYPNFGDAKYVTGLQTNVRPQRLVMILRHRIG